eukprot:gene11263-biopygen3563
MRIHSLRLNGLSIGDHKRALCRRCPIRASVDDIVDVAAVDDLMTPRSPGTKRSTRTGRTGFLLDHSWKRHRLETPPFGNATVQYRTQDVRE